MGDELHVRPFQGRQEVGAEEDPLAAEGVVGPDLLAQRGVLQLGAHEGGRAGAPDAPEGAGVADQHGQRLAVVEHESPSELLQARNPFEGGLGEGGVGPVLARQEPVPGALEDGQLSDLGGDLGHELDGARARPDDPDALALEGVVVVPFGGVEAVSLKALGFGDGGRVGFVKLTGCEDQRIGLPAVTLFGVDRPEMALLVPAAAR